MQKENLDWCLVFFFIVMMYSLKSQTPTTVKFIYRHSKCEVTCVPIFYLPFALSLFHDVADLG